MATHPIRFDGLARRAPGKPAHPTRTFRAPDVLWNAAKEKAHAEGVTLTYVLVKALQTYIHEDNDDA